MNHIDALELSWKHSADLVSGLRREDISAVTPCGDWDVRGLLNHTLGEAQMMTAVNRGLPSGNDHGDLVGDGGALAMTWHENLLNPTIYDNATSGAFTDVTGPGPDAGNVRVDFANGVDASGGLLYSVRTFNQDSSLRVTSGWDDVTGVGSPNSGWLTAIS